MIDRYGELRVLDRDMYNALRHFPEIKRSYRCIEQQNRRKRETIKTLQPANGNNDVFSNRTVVHGNPERISPLKCIRTVIMKRTRSLKRGMDVDQLGICNVIEAITFPASKDIDQLVANNDRHVSREVVSCRLMEKLRQMLGYPSHSRVSDEALLEGFFEILTGMNIKYHTLRNADSLSSVCQVPSDYISQHVKLNA